MHRTRKTSTLTDRFDSIKLIIFNVTLIALGVVFCAALIVYEAVSAWHFLREHLGR